MTDKVGIEGEGDVMDEVRRILSEGSIDDRIASMDPRLQRLVSRRSYGQLERATVSTGADQVAVIAIVDDLDAWEALSEVKVGARVGSAANGATIVTARLPVSRVEAVRRAPFVRSLKAAQPVRPTLRAGVREVGGRREDLPDEMRTAGGRGAVVGIVDYGCDFAHENFLVDGRKTRLLSIWDQGAATGPDSPFGYGREYSAANIEHALQQDDPYAALGYGPEKDTQVTIGTHGTHVLDIAAGNGRGSGVAGMAPEADLIFVDLSVTDVPFQGPQVVHTSFGDSVRLVEAVTYIFDKAGDRPCVVNLSLGTNGGPHDGTSLVEQSFDSLVRARPNRAIVISAGNAYDDGIHASGIVPSGDAFELEWVIPNYAPIPERARSHDELEIWYAGADDLSVDLELPGGNSFGPVGLGDTLTANAGNVVALFASNRRHDPNNNDNTIGVFIEAGAVSGIVRVRLHGNSADPVPFHAWIERDDLTPSKFQPPRDDSHTVGSISCGHASIVVGSYDAHKASVPISFFSASGPTRDGRQKPEVSAPGHEVLAAHSRTGNKVVAKSGTSMAAPMVTGLVALLLAEARQRGRDLSIDEIRDLLGASARINPPAPAGDVRWGAGRVGAAEAMRRLLDMFD